MARAYILKDPAQITLVFPKEKKYAKLPLADGWARVMDNLTPKAIVEHFKSGGYRAMAPARAGPGHGLQRAADHLPRLRHGIRPEHPRDGVRPEHPGGLHPDRSWVHCPGARRLVGRRGPARARD